MGREWSGKGWRGERGGTEGEKVDGEEEILKMNREERGVNYELEKRDLALWHNCHRARDGEIETL